MKIKTALFFACLAAGVFFFSQTLPAKTYRGAGQENLEGRTEQMAQDAERSKQMLEIWKDHVRTLTKERDDAYREIETLKASGVRGTQPAAAKTQAPGFEKTVEDLKGQIGRLTAERDELRAVQKRQALSADPELRAEMAAVQEENRNLKLALREVDDLRRDKEVLLREKEEALRKAEQGQNSSEDSSAAPLEESDRIRELQAKVAALEADLEKLSLVEREYEEARKFFSEHLTTLEEQNHQLSSELESMRTSGERAQALGQNLEALSAENESLKEQNDRKTAEIQSLKAQSETLRNETQSLRSANADLEKRLESWSEDRQTLAVLEKENAELREKITLIKSSLGALER